MITTASLSASAVHDAADRIRASVRRTPLVRIGSGPTLVKCESVQLTGSFKIRGVVAALTAVSVDHVVTGSSGNHGYALASAAGRRGVPVTVMMTRTSSPWKQELIRAEGAEVIVAADTNAERDAAARAHAAATGGYYLSSHDDPHVVAGQGTVVLEILEEEPSVCEVYVPVGGGGLLAGSCLAASAAGVRVVGVEPAGADRFTRSLAAGRRVRVPRVRTRCDGVRAQELGELAFEVCRGSVDRVVTVTDDEVVAAGAVLAAEGVVAEPSGALAFAGLLSADRAAGEVAVAIVSGGNVPSAGPVDEKVREPGSEMWWRG